VKSVYVPEVLDSLSKVSRKLVYQPEVIELEEAYLKIAGRVAQVRAAQAAVRLGANFRTFTPNFDYLSHSTCVVRDC
jgi:hypothetical protein